MHVTLCTDLFYNSIIKIFLTAAELCSENELKYEWGGGGGGGGN